MSLLPRLLRPSPALGRAYSSFFSSKPGGGRYFNSAKPPKSVVSAGRVKANGRDNAVTPAEKTCSSKRGDAKVSGSEDTSAGPPTSSPQPSEAASHPSPTVSAASLLSSSAPAFYDRIQPPLHPPITANELNLHQFFSLHRPLLLLSQPASAVFESVDSSTPFFSPQAVESDTQSASCPLIDDPPESSPEADADTARQLAHTLVVNRVGATTAWLDTLSRLGLVEEGAIGDFMTTKESAQKWANVYADSTRRKKRKKMKKHKLKKRRRLSRASRQNAK